MAQWSPCYNFLKEEFGTRRVTWNRLNPTAAVTLQCPAGWEDAVAYDLLEYHRPWPYRETYSTIPSSDCLAEGGQVPALPPLIAQSVTIRYPRTTYTDPNSEGDNKGQTMEYSYAMLDVSYAAEHGFFYKNIADTTQQDAGIAQWCQWNLYTEETWEPEIRFLTVDHELLEWNSISGLNGGARMPLEKAEELGIPYRRGKVVRKVSGYPDLDAIIEVDGGPSQIREWEGGVHKYEYISNIDGFRYAAGTLFVNSFKFRKTYYSFGNASSPKVNFTYTIEAELTYQKDTWDKFFRFVSDSTQDLSGFYPVWYKDTATQFTPFKQYDMRMFLFNDSDRTSLCPL